MAVGHWQKKIKFFTQKLKELNKSVIYVGSKTGTRWYSWSISMASAEFR